MLSGQAEHTELTVIGLSRGQGSHRLEAVLKKLFLGQERQAWEVTSK